LDSTRTEMVVMRNKWEVLISCKYLDINRNKQRLLAGHQKILIS
jgi:hypothetical protein